MPIGDELETKPLKDLVAHFEDVDRLMRAAIKEDCNGSDVVFYASENQWHRYLETKHSRLFSLIAKKQAKETFLKETKCLGDECDGTCLNLDCVGGKSYKPIVVKKDKTKLERFIDWFDNLEDGLVNFVVATSISGVIIFSCYVLTWFFKH